MGKLCFKTRNGVSPQGKPRVYFTCHKEDFAEYFDEISDLILKKQNCAVYYYDDGESVPGEEKDLDLSQMQLFVIPVTGNFLGKETSAYEYDFKYAIEHHIPVLPLLTDRKNTELFNQKCGNIQYLSINDNDETSISFDTKLENFLGSVLVGDELAEKIRAAFDAYVFLSYRKKDRKYAQELMRLIHQNEFCRDIAIWYDEFLVPGENFNDAISEAMQKSKLFALVVTPNLINEENYVMTTEYPMARESGMSMLPAEAVETDRAILCEKFKDIPECTNIHNGEELAASLYEGLKNIAVRTNDTSPQHNFFIGLAYLSGIDVEVDHERAVKLITFAAENGLPEAAKKLADMYKIGEGVQMDYDSAIKWQTKYCEILKEEWKKSGNVGDGQKYFFAKRELCNLYADLEKHEEVVKIVNEMEEGKEFMKESKNVVFFLEMSNRLARSQRRLRQFDEAEKNYKGCIEAYELLEQKNPGAYGANISVIYNNLARLYQDLKRFDEAEELYIKSLEIRKKKSLENPGVYDSFIALAYANLGALYYEKNNYDKAEEYFKKELEIREKLAENESSVSLDNLGDSYSQLADVFQATERYRESEKFRLKAFKIRKELAEKNPVLYEYDLVACYGSLGYLYRRTERYAEAEKMYIERLKINERRKNENPVIFEPHYATSCHNIGVLYNSMRKYDMAEKYFAEAVKIREKFYGEAPEVYEGSLSASYAQAAHNLRELKRLDEAEALYLKAIELSEKQCERNEEVYENDLASDYGNLGLLYREKRLFGKAEKMLLKAVEMKEKLVKENPEAYGRTLSLWYYETAILYFRASKIKKEIEYLLKALSVSEKLAKENPAAHESSVALYYGRLATAYKKEKRYDEAEEMYLKALPIREKLWHQNPKVHEGNMASLYNNIALFYEESGRTNSGLSEEYYLKVIAIREEQVRNFPEVYGAELKTGYTNIAYLYIKEKKYIKALKFFGKAASVGIAEEGREGNMAGIGFGITKIAESICGEGDADSGDIFKNGFAQILYRISILMQEWACNRKEGFFEDNLILSYRKSAKNAAFKTGAEAMYLKAIKTRDRQCAMNPMKYENELAKDLNTLGKFYEEWGKVQRAVSTYKKSIKIRRMAYKNNGAYREYLSRDYNNLGLYLKKQKRYDEAESYYMKSVEIDLEIGDERRRSLATTYSNLGLLYYASGDALKENEYFEKAVALYEELALENPEEYSEKLEKRKENLKNAQSRLK